MPIVRWPRRVRRRGLAASFDHAHLSVLLGSAVFMRLAATYNDIKIQLTVRVLSPAIQVATGSRVRSCRMQGSESEMYTRGRSGLGNWPVTIPTLYQTKFQMEIFFNARSMTKITCNAN